MGSDLNLVDGLLVFLLSGLEETFCVIDHLLQTVLLLERERRDVQAVFVGIDMHVIKYSNTEHVFVW